MLPDLTGKTDAELEEYRRCIHERRRNAVAKYKHYKALLLDQERELDRVFRERMRRDA